MQGICERIAMGTRKEFATPWEVCFNVAHPPSEFKNNNILQGKGNGRGLRSRCPFAFDLKQKGK